MLRSGGFSTGVLWQAYRRTDTFRKCTLGWPPSSPLPLQSNKNPELAIQRRNQVLSRMAEERFISQDEMIEAKQNH